MTTPVGKKSHSGLHDLKRRKNLLARAITNAKITIHTKLGNPSQAAYQSERQLLRLNYRAMHLADCYIRGRLYSKVEGSHEKWPTGLWFLVRHHVFKAGGPIVPMPSLDEWKMAN